MLSYYSENFPEECSARFHFFFFCGRNVHFSCLLELVFSRFVVR